MQLYAVWLQIIQENGMFFIDIGSIMRNIDLFILWDVCRTFYFWLYLIHFHQVPWQGSILCIAFPVFSSAFMIRMYLHNTRQFEKRNFNYPLRSWKKPGSSIKTFENSRWNKNYLSVNENNRKLTINEAKWDNKIIQFLFMAVHKKSS